MDTVHECDGRTDGQTDRQTDRITITKTVQRIASHGKKTRMVQFPATAAIEYVAAFVTRTRTRTKTITITKTKT